MIDQLREYADAGFALVLLRPNSKKPIEAEWTIQPVVSFKQLRTRYKVGQNVGVRLGKWSQVDGLYLHVVDVDIRKIAREREAIDKLDELLDGIEWREFPIVVSGSGGASFHVYFVSQAPFKGGKLAKSHDTFIDSNGKTRRYWEIELFGTGKQVVLPPSIHPDTGLKYKWERKPDFDAGLPVIDGEILADLLAVPNDAAHRASPTEATDLEVDEVQDILGELQDLANDRETWIRVGMALKHQLGAKKGWPIFDRWSKKGDGYDRDRNWIDWRSFKNDHPNPITLRTLIHQYRKRMRLAALAELDAEDEPTTPEAHKVSGSTHRKDSDRLHDVPKHILSVPGALQEIVDFFNNNSMVDQPEFAVMAALGFGSVIAGRNTVTTLRNHSSIYLLGIGGSGSGKESVRTTVNHMLNECGFPQMRGPQYMTSEGALLTALMVSPKLLLAPDEMGKRMKEDRGSGNPYTEGVNRAYMSVFGSLHSEWKPQGYSGQGKSKEEIKNIVSREVVRPALTLVGMTTPSTFYEAVSSADVASGFMSRFVVIQGRPGIQEQSVFVPEGNCSPSGPTGHIELIA